MILKEDIITQNFIKHDRYQATDKKYSKTKWKEHKYKTSRLLDTSIKT